MTLPASDREELHHRRIDLRVYRRADGLYEVDGRVVDRKTHDHTRPLADRATPAGTALHDIWVRLVVDEHWVVRDITASSDATPFGVCTTASQTLAVLKGERIAAGWNRRVREALGGAASCTHIMELLGPMATAAIQGMVPVLAPRPVAVDAQGRPRKIDSCLAYAAGGPVVEVLWPAFHARAGNKADES